MVINTQVRSLFFLFLALSLLPGLVLANQTLQASVDRNLVELGDIIQLNISGNFQTTQRPNLEPLKTDFEVLGSQASNQLQIIHGQYSAVTNWDVQLLAKRTGDLRIPPFEIEGLQTQPIHIQVAEASRKQADYQVSFLEAQVDNPMPYVQSEVIYTLRYYHLGSLVRGNIDSPQFDGFMVERLQNQRSFERQVAGRTYRVYEWVYALYPQNSGTLSIPAQSFDGTLLHQRQLRQVEQTSEAIELEVKPIPAEFPAHANWLPAKSIELTDEWTQPTSLKAGETLGRRITLKARGLKASQLPSLEWNETEDYRLYSDPVSQNDHIQAGGLSSHKIQDFMMVVHNQGQLKFETIEIPWWNTRTDQLEIARLDTRVFNVESNPVLEQALNLTDPAIDGINNPTQDSSTIWQGISAILAVLWIITLLLLKRRNNTQHPKIESTNHLKNVPLDEANIVQLSQLTNVQLDVALKKWLKIHYQIADWSELKNKHPKLFELMQALQIELYHPNAADTKFDRNALFHELNGLSTHQQNQSGSPLAELYPEQKPNA